MPSPRFRNVCFTWNNPGEGTEIDFDEERMRYLVYQFEVGASGTPHIQGYVEFVRKISLTRVKELLGSPTIHVEARQGTAAQASDYCKKDETRMVGTAFREHGELSSPGKRNDLKDFKDAVLTDRKRKRELVEEHFGTLARYPKFYDTLKSLKPPRRDPDRGMQVILHIGSTALGKTRTVYDAHGNDEGFFVTPLSNGTPWYDGYDEHEIVLLDDFAGSASHLQLVTLLRLLDRYPVLVPIKGSHTHWLPYTIYVTTNICPSKWYKWEGREKQFAALARRFTSVREFHPKLHDDDPGYTERDLKEFWGEISPPECLVHVHEFFA